MTALPTWIPQETWDAFVEMRKKTLKKPPTDFALHLILRRLFALRDEGHDPLACLEESIVNGWSGVFPVKNKAPNPKGQMDDYEKTKARTRADAAKALPKDVNAENARKVREAVQQMKQRGLLQ